LAIGLLIAAGIAIIKNWDKIKESNKKTFETIQQIIDTVVKTVKPIIEDMGKFFVKQFSKITKFVTKNMPLIQKTIDTAMKAIKVIFEIVWPVIAAVVENAWKIIKIVIGTAIDVILKVIKLAMQIFTGDWKGAWGTIGQIAVSILTGLKDVLLGLVGAFFDVGVNLVKAIWQGMKSLAGWIGRQVVGFFKGTIDAAKGALGISSPSKEFMELAKNSVKGFVKGLNAGNPLVFDATANVAGAALSGGAFNSFQPRQESNVININGNIILPGVRNPEDFMSELNRQTRTANLRNRVTNG
jgi:phage-related protein